MSQGSVNCLTQDRAGFIWLGTQDGLNRYDGYKFKTFRHDPGDSNSIPNEWIHALYNDRSGTVWIGSDGGGLSKWITSENRFETIPLPGRVNPRSSYPVKAICEDRDGKLWVGSDGDGLIQYDKEKKHFVHYTRDLTNTNSPGSNNISSLAEDPEGHIWIGTTGGLDRFEKANKRFTHFRKDDGLQDESVLSILVSRKGLLIVGTETGLHIYENNSNRFIYIPLIDEIFKKNKPFSVRSIYEDQKGNIWIGTYGNGLLKLDVDNRRLLPQYSSWAEDNLLANEFILSIFEDRSGLLWIGTDGDGVNKLIRNSGSFLHFRHHEKNSGSLSENYVFAFCEDTKGNLWIGTYGGGLNRLDTLNRTFAHYMEIPGSFNGLNSNNILSLFCDSLGNIWVGTADAGLCKFNPDRLLFTQYKKNSGHGLKSNVIRSIVSAPAGKLWIGTDAGLYLLDPVSDTFTEYSFQPDRPQGLSDNTIWWLYTDRLDILWIGTRNGGLNRFDPQTQKFIVYKNDPQTVNSMPANGIWCIYEDRADRLWLGTAGGGLILFGRNSNTFTRFTEKDGLPNQVIYGILEDNTGNLWLSTNNGISRFDPKKKLFTNYDVYDGLQSNEFNSGAFFKNRKGELLFGGVNGFNLFDPKDVTANEQIPPVVLTAFRKFDQPIPLNDWEKPVIDLTYKENSFSFEFAALDYARPEKNQYAYTMEGFDQGWIFAGTKHDVTYTNLDHGTYTFRVKASNNDRVWNEKGLSVKINISPPVWKTWWFRLFLLGGLALVMYRSYTYRTRKIQKKNKELERLIAERTRNLEKANAELKIANEKILRANDIKSRFLANMSHELRTPLNSIIGFSDLLTQGMMGPIPPEQEESIKAISTSSKSLLKLINDVLDLSKIEAGKMTLKRSPIHFDEIVNNVWYLMRPLFDQKQQTFSTVIPKHLPVLSVDENKIKQVFINLLSNATKFTPPGGKISLHAFPISYNGHADDFLEIRISDSGKGIPPDELETVFEEFRQASDSSENQGTGLGLALSKRIIELHGGKIWAESDGKSGSEFIIHLPIQEHSSS